MRSIGSGYDEGDRSGSSAPDAKTSPSQLEPNECLIGDVSWMQNLYEPCV